MIINQAQLYKTEVITLLESENLPIFDLPEQLDGFLVAIDKKRVIGIIGVEECGTYGLLRSLAVHPDFRGKGIAGKLIRRVEALCSLKSYTALFLLTETAPDYFEAKGYQQIKREDVLVEVQSSPEFSHVCPVSAIVMKKTL